MNEQNAQQITWAFNSCQPMKEQSWQAQRMAKNLEYFTG